MRKTGKGKKTVLVLVALLFSIAPVPAGAAGSEDRAASYLKTKPVDEWSVMALAAADSLAGTGVDFLKQPIGTGRATDYEKRILAVVAAGQSPSAWGEENFLTGLKAKFDGTQIGDRLLVNDDIFGLLALAAAGENGSREAAASKTFLLSSQNSDGGWGYGTGVASDSNDTAMALAALLSTGAPEDGAAVTRGFGFLDSLKQTDGGYAYQSGLGSDTASTAWAVSSFRKARRQVENQSIAYLENQQLPDGSLRWQPSDSSGSTLMTAYGLIALTAKTYPITIGTNNTGAPNFRVCIFGVNGRNIWNDGLSFGPPARAIDAVSEAAKLGNFSYVITSTSFGPYVQAIAGDEASGITGWMYRVNTVSPAIGAADFILQKNDEVVWFYGQSGDSPPACGQNTIADKSSGSVDLQVMVEVAAPKPVIGFMVSPNSINFGTLKPGEQNSQTLSFRNTGNVSLNITAEVTDSSGLFSDNLRIAGLRPADFRSGLAAGQSREVTAGLRVPENFSASGLRKARIVFWASP